MQLAKTAALYGGNATLWTAAKINVKSGATLAFNVGGTGEFSTGNVTTLLTNLAASSSATNGMNAGSGLGFDTTNATGGSFTISNNLTDTTGGSGGNRSLTKLGANVLVLAGNNTYTGGTNLNGGTLALNSANALGPNGTISFAGGTLQWSANNTVDYSARFATAANQTYSVDTNGQDVTLATALTSSGGTLTKLGSGNLTLTANNTYSGLTTISAGRLVLSGSGGVAGDVMISTGASYDVWNLGGAVVKINRKVTNNGTLYAGTGNVVTVNGTLAGNGTVTGNVVVVGGTLAPGNSTGVMTITGDLSLDSTSAITIGINGPGRGTGYNAMTVNGATTLGGALNLYFPAAVDASFQGTYGIFDFGTSPTASLGSVSVYYNNVLQSAGFAQSGSTWTGAVGTTVFTLDQITGNLTVVPEPAEADAAVVALLAGLVGWRVRTRRAEG